MKNRGHDEPGRAVLNIGSLNIDHVYQVPHFARPGETLTCLSYKRFCGGKGCNQSVALGRAGARVSHAGLIGSDGEWLKAYLSAAGADVSLVRTIDGPSGHAVIQVNPKGENSIVIHGGANRRLTVGFVDEALAGSKPGDLLLIQNEINLLGEIIVRAKKKGMVIAFNPAPFTRDVLELPLEHVEYFFLNRIEGAELAGTDDEAGIGRAFLAKFPAAKQVLTLGSDGAVFFAKGEEIRVEAERVEVVDTTGAGDTFIGYFMAELAAGAPVRQCLSTACRAAAVCVGRPGAADSIPARSEL